MLSGFCLLADTRGFFPSVSSRGVPLAEGKGEAQKRSFQSQPGP